MITAQEAKRLTEQKEEQAKLKAIEWVNSELHFLEDRINEAIANCKYSTDYWWSKEFLKDAGLTQRDAKIGLTHVLSLLGYYTEYCFNWSNEGVFRIVISWGEY